MEISGSSSLGSASFARLISIQGCSLGCILFSREQRLHGAGCISKMLSKLWACKEGEKGRFSPVLSWGNWTLRQERTASVLIFGSSYSWELCPAPFLHLSWDLGMNAGEVALHLGAFTLGQQRKARDFISTCWSAQVQVPGSLLSPKLSWVCPGTRPQPGLPPHQQPPLPLPVEDTLGRGKSSA